MRDKLSSDESIKSSEAQTVRRALAQARREEARLLEAYRRGIISPAQLGKELELLKQRQSALDIRSASLRSGGKGTNDNIFRRTAEEFCRAAAERLQTFNEAERQQFLRLIVDTVIFEGEQVRIRAVISLTGAAQATHFSEQRVSDFSGVADFDIAAMNTHLYGHNTGVSKDQITDMTTDTHGRNEVGRYYSESPIFEGETCINYISFELRKGLPRKPFSILSEEGLRLVKRLKLKQGDPTLRELCRGVREERGVHVSVTHMSRALRRLGMSPIRRGPSPPTRDGLKQAA